MTRPRDEMSNQETRFLNRFERLCIFFFFFICLSPLLTASIKQLYINASFYTLDVGDGLTGFL